MKASTSLGVLTSDPLLLTVLTPALEFPDIPKSWYEWFYTTISHVQDIIYVAVKLKAHLLKPLIVLPLGKYSASSKHLSLLRSKFAKDLHGLQDKDISHKDRQNFDAVQHIIKHLIY